MIKFIHTGDLHLGLQFTKVSFSPKIANERRMELWNTFQRIVDRGIEDGIDFLFIAGDLFEEKYFTLGDIKRVRDTLAKARDMNIIIVAGNHDTLNISSLYNYVEWPSNVSLFGTGGIKKEEFLEKNMCVYGYSWDKGENTEDVFKDFDGIDREKINVLLIHGDIFNRESKYLPLDRGRLNEIGFDYIGLGHIHKPEIINNSMAYCGSPEPLHFGELGEHGFIQGRIGNGNTEIKFIPFSNRKFIEKTVEIDESLGYIDVLDRIKECDEIGELKKNLYRINLKGIVDRDVAGYIHGISKELETFFYYIEVRDDTIIDYDLEALEMENEDNIIGQFIKEMRNKDLEDKVNKDALYIGLETLMKGRVGR